ncbi:MAG: class I SAM-dependent methyltransferase [Acidobacteriota bacterium]|nr:class I SAM-dependent methyltransferase [Acidobacteriota bacterium]
MSSGLPTPWLVSLRRSLRRRLLGRGKPRPAATWDAQYRAGTWDGIVAEIERHACIASFVRRFGPERPFVLDVGCGQGALARQLRGDACGRYVGIDISSEAILRAAKDGAQGESFHAVDVEAGPPSFVTPGSVDAAVFSEVLYYLDDPLETLRRFVPLLSPSGFFVFSLWKPARHRALRRGLCRAYDETCVREVGSGNTWRISVAALRGRSLSGGA